MAEFSFENDIAPMRGSYFSDSSLNDRERRQLQSDYTQRVAPYQSSINKNLERMLDLQTQELNFQRTNNAFEQAKFKLQQEREAAEKYPDIEAQLGAAMEGKSPSEQHILVADIALKNPAFFKTEGGSALISAYGDRISAGAAAEQDTKAKKNSVYSMAAQSGYADVAAAVDNGSISYEEGLTEMARRKADERQRTEDQKNRDELTSRQFNFLEDAVNEALSVFKTQQYDNGTSSGGVNDIIDGKGPKKFSEAYKNELNRSILILNKLTDEDLKEMKKLSDAELHKYLGDSITRQRSRLFNSSYIGGQGEPLQLPKKPEGQDDSDSWKLPPLLNR